MRETKSEESTICTRLTPASVNAACPTTAWIMRVLNDSVDHSNRTFETFTIRRPNLPRTTCPVTRLIGTWKCFWLTGIGWTLTSLGNRPRDYLAISFPGQFQSPMVIVAVRVFPIERHRPTGNFDVVNWEGSWKESNRLQHRPCLRCPYSHCSGILVCHDKLTFLRA